MPTTIPFDTHAYVKKLTAVGVPEAQAEVHARALAELIDEQLATKRDIAELRIATKHDIDELYVAAKRDIDDLRIATKRDIDELRIATERDLKELEIRIRSELQRVELRLTLRFGGMLAAAVAIVVALVKLL